MEPRKETDELCQGAYPPDGVPFAPIEYLAERYWRYLECNSDAPVLTSVHLAAWAVATGVAKPEEIEEALAAAKARVNDAVGRLVELRRLLAPLFARYCGLQFIIVKQRPASMPSPADPKAETRLLAEQIAEALGAPSIAAGSIEHAADQVMRGRMVELEVWAMVARARAILPGDPGRAFTELYECFQRGRRVGRPPIQLPKPPAAELKLVDRLLPSLN